MTKRHYEANREQILLKQKECRLRKKLEDLNNFVENSRSSSPKKLLTSI